MAFPVNAPLALSWDGQWALSRGPGAAGGDWEVECSCTVRRLEWEVGLEGLWAPWDLTGGLRWC